MINFILYLATDLDDHTTFINEEFTKRLACKLRLSFTWNPGWDRWDRPLFTVRLRK